MKNNQIFPFCRKNGIELPLNWNSSCNCVRPHDRNETYNHWNYKCEIFRAIYVKGEQTIFTEFKFDYRTRFGNQPRMKNQTCDILWLDEMIIIELESKLTEKTRRLKLEQFRDFNTFVFDISKISVPEILEKIGI